MFILIYSSSFHSSSSLATDRTQLMRHRAECEAHIRSQLQFILLEPWRRSEAEALQQGGEEEEELHLGQTLSQTHPSA